MPSRKNCLIQPRQACLSVSQQVAVNHWAISTRPSRQKGSSQ
ncbi:hypothetical protein E2320_017670 [Naja naja]|nr:hypothetical protein E2320_017670 [Naja naja]